MSCFLERSFIAVSFFAATTVCFITHAFADGDEGFTPIFNGKDLTGWEGEPGYWSVEQGAITGTTTAEQSLKKPIYLFWRGGRPADFELRALYRISGQSGNSGINFRSQELPNWDVKGYDPGIHHGWATWWDYDGGGLCFGVTGWGTHSYDQINCALGTDDTGPVEVTLEEPVADRETGKFASRKSVGGVVVGDTGDADTGADYHGMAKLSGPRAKVSMKFANGTELKLHLDGDHGPGLGAIFVGEKGKIEINRNKLAGNPKELVKSPDNPGPNKRPETAYHIENWVDCLKSRQRCNADIEIGQRSSTLCYLVNIARDVGKVGEPLAWDPATKRFTHCDEANKMLDRPRRKGHELPTIM
jgi:hypothetical protein